MIQKSLTYTIFYRYFVDKQNESSGIFTDYLIQKSDHWIQSVIPTSTLKKMIAPRLCQLHVNYITNFYGKGFLNNKLYEIGNKHINSILDYMGDNKYFFGDTPTYIDLIIYAWFSVLYNDIFNYGDNDIKSPSPDIVREYINRMNKRLFPEIKSWKEYNLKQPGSILDITLPF